MGNDLIDVSGIIGGAAPKIDPDVQTLAGSFLSEIIEERHGQPMLPALPNQRERLALSNESSRLFEGMRPIRYSSAGLERGAQVVAAILGGYPQLAGLDAVVKQKMMAAYVAKLSDLPLFSIVEAQAEIKRGSDIARKYEVRPGYPPSDAQVYQIANHLCGALREAKALIDKVLSVQKVLPPPLVPEDREKVGGMIRELADTLRKPLDAEWAERKAQREAATLSINNRWIIREYREKGLEPHYDKNGNLVTLATLLRTGFVIKERGDQVFLVPPPGWADRHEQQVQSPEV